MLRPRRGACLPAAAPGPGPASRAGVRSRPSGGAVDPPRGGLASALIARIAQAKVKKTIYFSCDSATFARDLRLFLKLGYDLQELKIIDNCPQTDHFEIFSVL
jgi:23S rRNA (uracil1939-C5)-methyltransferase